MWSCAPDAEGNTSIHGKVLEAFGDFGAIVVVGEDDQEAFGGDTALSADGQSGSDAVDLAFSLAFLHLFTPLVPRFLHQVCITDPRKGLVNLEIWD